MLKLLNGVKKKTNLRDFSLFYARIFVQVFKK